MEFTATQSDLETFILLKYIILYLEAQSGQLYYRFLGSFFCVYQDSFDCINQWVKSLVV